MSGCIVNVGFTSSPADVFLLFSDTVAEPLSEAASSIRSAMSRNALLCLQEIMAAPIPALANVIGKLGDTLRDEIARTQWGLCTGSFIDILISRAAGDKNFIRKAATQALEEVPRNERMCRMNVSSPLALIVEVPFSLQFCAITRMSFVAY